MNKPTIVTMYFDLADKEQINRPGFNFYSQYADYILNQDCPMVIFTEWRFCSYFLEKRTFLGRNTRVVPVPFHNMPYSHAIEDIKRLRHNKPMKNANNLKDTPEYTALCWSKIVFLYEVARRNPFNSNKFAWVDLGITKIAAKPTINPFDITDRRMSFLCLRLPSFYDCLFNETFYDYERGIIAAGYITGAQDQIFHFFRAFEAERRSSMKLGYAPSEQQIFARIIFNEQFQCKGEYKIWFGDYIDILRNYHIPYTVQHFLHFNLHHPNQQYIQDILKNMLSTHMNVELKGQIHKSIRGKWSMDIIKSLTQVQPRNNKEWSPPFDIL